MAKDVTKKDLETILKAMEWFDKVMYYFRPYKPETKSLDINYRRKKAEIELLLNIPTNLKRKIRKVEVPAYQDFVISEMRDEVFNRIGVLWRYEDGKWKLDASKLPSSEKYLLTLEGHMPEKSLSKIVYIQPSSNKDRTEEMDRYWLSSMIRNVEIIEKLWDALNVNDIIADVNIGIERCFSVTVSDELKERFGAVRRWTKAGYGRDKEEVHKAWLELYRYGKKSKISFDEIINIIYRLTSGDIFSSFIDVDEPYKIGEIKRDERFRGLFPQSMHTEASTYLTLTRPTATGYLSFKKKDYTEKVKEEIEKFS